MAESHYEFEAVGWMDANDQRYEGTPSDLDNTFGVWVNVTNPDDPEDVHMFWAYVYTPFKDWAEWWVYIGALMQSHGLELA